MKSCNTFEINFARRDRTGTGRAGKENEILYVE